MNVFMFDLMIDGNVDERPMCTSQYIDFDVRIVTDKKDLEGQ